MRRCARSLAASAMPSGSPMTMQNSSEVSTSASVTMACSHTPSAATTASESTAPRAVARPANCQASSPSRAAITGMGVPVSRRSAPPSVPSMGARTA